MSASSLQQSGELRKRHPVILRAIWVRSQARSRSRNVCRAFVKRHGTQQKHREISPWSKLLLSTPRAKNGSSLLSPRSGGAIPDGAWPNKALHATSTPPLRYGVAARERGRYALMETAETPP